MSSIKKHQTDVSNELLSRINNKVEGLGTQYKTLSGLVTANAQVLGNQDRALEQIQSTLAKVCSVLDVSQEDDHARARPKTRQTVVPPVKTKMSRSRSRRQTRSYSRSDSSGGTPQSASPPGIPVPLGQTESPRINFRVARNFSKARETPKTTQTTKTPQNSKNSQNSQNFSQVAQGVQQEDRPSTSRAAHPVKAVKEASQPPTPLKTQGAQASSSNSSASERPAKDCPFCRNIRCRNPVDCGMALNYGMRMTIHRRMQLCPSLKCFSRHRLLCTRKMRCNVCGGDHHRLYCAELARREGKYDLEQ